jgi:hypothetical protein
MMALTLEQQQRLERVSLVTLFDGQNALWTEIAKSAYAYTKGIADRAAWKVRQDDVAPALVQALRVSVPLGEYLGQEKLREKYWVDWFAHLILDRLWNDLEGGRQT